jgi:hypothetical protein
LHRFNIHPLKEIQQVNSAEFELVTFRHLLNIVPIKYQQCCIHQLTKKSAGEQA